MIDSTVAGIAAGISGLLGAAGLAIFTILHLNARAAVRAKDLPQVIAALKASNVKDPTNISPSTLSKILKNESDLNDKIIRQVVSAENRTYERISLISAICLFLICFACVVLWAVSPSHSSPQSHDRNATVAITELSESDNLKTADNIGSTKTSIIETKLVDAIREIDIDNMINEYRTLSPHQRQAAKNLMRIVIQGDRSLVQLMASERPRDLVVDATQAVCYLVTHIPNNIAINDIDLEILDSTVSKTISKIVNTDNSHSTNLSRQIQTLLRLMGDDITANAIASWASISANDGPSPDPQFTPSADTMFIFVSSADGDDSFNGRTPATAKKTLNAAMDLFRPGKPDWILLKRGEVFRAHGKLRPLVGRGPGEYAILAGYGEGKGKDPILILPDSRNQHWPNSSHGIVVGVEIIR